MHDYPDIIAREVAELIAAYQDGQQRGFAAGQQKADAHNLTKDLPPALTTALLSPKSQAWLAGYSVGYHQGYDRAE